MSAYLYIILILVLIIILVILGNYNKLITLLNRVKKAQANIEVQLNKRFNLIPNVVETVKGYAKHEKTTLTDITELRNSYNEEKNITMKKASQMNDRLSKLLVTIEAYPELKANENFLNLQSQLTKIEDELSRYRTIYNEEVNKYNTLVEKVPSNIIASMFSFKKKEFFQTEEDKKENIKVEI